MPAIGECRSAFGHSSGHASIWARISGDALIRNQDSPSALIATAAGLFAAIPAVYFYNHFTHKVRGFAAAMEDFSLEFLNISERNFT